MKPRRYYHLMDQIDPRQGLVTGFTDPNPIQRLSFVSGDNGPSRHYFLRENPNATTGKPFFFVDPSTFDSAKFGGGVTISSVDGGNWTLFYNTVASSGVITWDASALVIQTQIRAAWNAVGFANATLEGDFENGFYLDRGSDGVAAEITAAESLSPEGSEVQITKIQEGVAGGRHARWQIKLTRALPLYQDQWTNSPAASLGLAIAQAGSATQNKSYNITPDPEAYDGQFFLQVTAKTGTAETVGPILWNASESDIIAKFMEHSVLGVSTEVTVAVTKNLEGVISVTFIETQGKSDIPTIALGPNQLKIPPYLEGDLVVSGPGADELFEPDADEVTITLQMEVVEAGKKQTCSRMSTAVFLRDLIPNIPGRRTADQSFYSASESKGLFVQNKTLTVTSHAALKAIVTVNNAVVTNETYLIYYNEMYEVWHLVAWDGSGPGGDNPVNGLAYPNDYDSSTNDRAWVRKGLLTGVKPFTAATRAATWPDFPGQIGVETDTKRLYIGQTAGSSSWTSNLDAAFVGEMKPWAGPVVPNSNWALCFGQSLLRSDFPELFAALTTTVTGTISNGSPNVTILSQDLNNLGAILAMKCEGAGIPAGATITRSGVSTGTLSANATASGAITITLIPWGYVDATHFYVPDMRGMVAAGRANMGGTDRAGLADISNFYRSLGIQGTDGLFQYALTFANLPEHWHSTSTQIVDQNFDGTTTNVVSGVEGKINAAPLNGGAFKLLQPTNFINWIIKTK